MFFKILLQYSFRSLDLRGYNQRGIEKGENTVDHCLCTEKVTWTQYWNPDTWASKEKLSVGHWAKLVESLCRYWRHLPSSPLPPQFPNSKEKRKKRLLNIFIFLNKEMRASENFAFTDNLYEGNSLRIPLLLEDKESFPFLLELERHILLPAVALQNIYE